MFQNRLYKESRKEISKADLKKIEKITFKEREFRKKRYVEEMAYYTMLWLKYFRNENTSYFNLVHGVLYDEFTYSDFEISKMAEQSQRLLKEKYAIDVVSTDPLILSSRVPFYCIKEDFE